MVWLLDEIEPAAGSVARMTAQEDCRSDFFCCWLSTAGHGGPSFEAATLKRVSALNAALGIDFYWSPGHREVQVP